MSLVDRIVVVAAVVAVATGGAPRNVGAQACGDADNNGSVTVTDGVNMLRAAAQLSTPCVLQICDMNLDGEITVTDGVIALRQAAELQGPGTCSRAQVSEVVDKTRAILETGIGIPGLSSAHISKATDPCPGGGSMSVNPGRVDYFDCVDGEFRYAGTLTVSQDAVGNVTLTTSQLAVFGVVTGESQFLSGSLFLSFDDSGNTTVDGSLTISSDVLGDFAEQFQGIVLDQSDVMTSGDLMLEIRRGLGAFASFRSLHLQFVGPVVLADVTFTDGSSAGVFIDNSTDGRGVCTPCTGATDCGDGLLCFGCADECTGSTARCSIDFDTTLECQDGFF